MELLEPYRRAVAAEDQQVSQALRLLKQRVIKRSELMTPQSSQQPSRREPRQRAAEGGGSANAKLSWSSATPQRAPASPSTARAAEASTSQCMRSTLCRCPKCTLDYEIIPERPKAFDVRSSRDIQAQIQARHMLSTQVNTASPLQPAIQEDFSSDIADPLLVMGTTMIRDLQEMRRPGTRLRLEDDFKAASEGNVGTDGSSAATATRQIHNEMDDLVQKSPGPLAINAASSTEGAAMRAETLFVAGRTGNQSGSLPKCLVASSSDASNSFGSEHTHDALMRPELASSASDKHPSSHVSSKASEKNVVSSVASRGGKFPLSTSHHQSTAANHSWNLESAYIRPPLAISAPQNTSAAAIEAFIRRNGAFGDLASTMESCASSEQGWHDASSRGQFEDEITDSHTHSAGPPEVQVASASCIDLISSKLDVTPVHGAGGVQRAVLSCFLSVRPTMPQTNLAPSPLAMHKLQPGSKWATNGVWQVPTGGSCGAFEPMRPIVLSRPERTSIASQTEPCDDSVLGPTARKSMVAETQQASAQSVDAPSPGRGRVASTVSSSVMSEDCTETEGEGPGSVFDQSRSTVSSAGKEIAAELSPANDRKVCDQLLSATGSRMELDHKSSPPSSGLLSFRGRAAARREMAAQQRRKIAAQIAAGTIDDEEELRPVAEQALDKSPTSNVPDQALEREDAMGTVARDNSPEASNCESKNVAAALNPGDGELGKPDSPRSLGSPLEAAYAVSQDTPSIIRSVASTSKYPGVSPSEPAGQQPANAIPKRVAAHEAGTALEMAVATSESAVGAIHDLPCGAPCEGPPVDISSKHCDHCDTLSQELFDGVSSPLLEECDGESKPLYSISPLAAIPSKTEPSLGMPARGVPCLTPAQILNRKTEHSPANSPFTFTSHTLHTALREGATAPHFAPSPVPFAVPSPDPIVGHGPLSAPALHAKQLESTLAASSIVQDTLESAFRMAAQKEVAALHEKSTAAIAHAGDWRRRRSLKLRAARSASSSTCMHRVPVTTGTASFVGRSSSRDGSVEHGFDGAAPLYEEKENHSDGESVARAPPLRALAYPQNTRWVDLATLKGSPFHDRVHLDANVDTQIDGGRMKGAVQHSRRRRMPLVLLGSSCAVERNSFEDDARSKVEVVDELYPPDGGAACEPRADAETAHDSEVELEAVMRTGAQETAVSSGGDVAVRARAVLSVKLTGASDQKDESIVQSYAQRITDALCKCYRSPQTNSNLGRPL